MKATALPVILLVLWGTVKSNPVNDPKLIGSLSTLKHAVSGSVYAVDEKTLMIKDFNYDGAGPDAFFWVGTEGSPTDVEDESKTAILAHPYQGVHYEYRNEDAPVLKASSQEAITLFLPDTMKVSDLKWISVWCRQFSVDFGNLMFPADLKVPGGEAVPEPEAEAEAEPEPEAEAEAEAESEPEPSKTEELPHPAVIGNSVEAEPEPESEAESEPEPESESEPEYKHEHGHEHEEHDHHNHEEHDHHDHGEEEHHHHPNSLESKSEPEPQPGSAESMYITPLVTFFIGAILVNSL